MSSTIWAWMVTSSAVVGSSAMSSLGSQARAMAIMTRWRMPSRELVRILPRAALRRRDTDLPKGLDGAIGCLLLGHHHVLPDRLCDLVARPEDGVQARHGLLEDHGDLVAAQLAHVVFLQAQDVLSLEEDLAADDLGGGSVQEAHDRQRGDGLAAA